MFVKLTLKEAEERARNAVKTLAECETVIGAYLFGSYVDGRADKWSDIDIGVFVEGAENWDLEKDVDASSKVQIKEGDDIELHFFPANQLKDAEPASFAKYIMKHGRPIKWAT